MVDIKEHTLLRYEPLWGAWRVESFIGQGSFGKVYKVYRNDYGKTYYSAVKIISIPQNDSELQRLKSKDPDEVSIRAYFQRLVTDIANEIDLMSAFKGNSNVVSFLDHQIIDKSEFFQDSQIESRPVQLGWDVLIRMELLTSLAGYIKEKPLSIAEVIELGIHICRALELCAQKNVIHRDIKPDNIFISEFGEYKLGDFGIARRIEQTMHGLSRKGTYATMAPEVFKGERYGASVDTYALGMVMYSLLNHNRFPFLPDYPHPILPGDQDGAIKRRMSGEPIPVLTNLSSELDTLVRKACAFNREERFACPADMRKTLESLEADKEKVSCIPMTSVETETDLHGEICRPQQQENSETLRLLSQVKSHTSDDQTEVTENGEPIHSKEYLIPRDITPSSPSHNRAELPEPSIKKGKHALGVGLSAVATVVIFLVGIITFYAFFPKVYGISIDGQMDIFVANKKEVSEVLDALTKHYASLLGANSVVISSVRYEEEVVSVKISSTKPEIMNKQDALEALINNYCLTVILEGEYEVTEEIDFETETKTDATLSLDTTQVRQEGRKGLRNVTYSFASTNGVCINQIMLTEIIIEEPVKEVILKGSRIVELTDAIAALPSEEAIEVLWNLIQGYWTNNNREIGFIYDDSARHIAKLSCNDSLNGGFGELRDARAAGEYKALLTIHFDSFNVEDNFSESTYIVRLDLTDFDKNKMIGVSGSGGVIGSNWDGEYTWFGNTRKY
ncbi:MAG: protein kinase [Peptococcaceae bacterium]|nr:protein kinase [Peptococcaceae bacterium]